MTENLLTAELSFKPGIEFQSLDIQNMQNDDFQNPGMLFVDAGEQLASTPVGKTNKACIDCHENFDGVARQFPKFNARLKETVSLTSQILACRTDHQQAEALSYESKTALSLATYVTHQSRGLSYLDVDDGLREAIARGRDYYYSRKGQLNLACVHCHEQNSGKFLRGDLISDGVSTGYPIYRLEWQGMGSLHRRFRACDIGVRAEPAMMGGQVYTELELYLRTRATGLTITAPGVRR
jgi:sulfur-oxidizing protein SoxA